MARIRISKPDTKPVQPTLLLQVTKPKASKTMTQQDKTNGAAEAHDETNAANFHFYAANLGTWATTTPQRDLPALIRMMEKDELPYVLMYLPVPHDAD